MFIDSELNLSILVNLPKNLGLAQYFRFCTQNILIFKRKSLQILQKYGHFVVTLQIINIEIGMGISFQLFIIEKKNIV